MKLIFNQYSNVTYDFSKNFIDRCQLTTLPNNKFNKNKELTISKLPGTKTSER